MTLLGALLVSAPMEGFGSEEAMLKLFKILRDRGSISEAEYQQLAGMTAKEKAKEKAGDITLYHAPVCIVPPFNGTRADPTAAGHADNVRQLLPKALQRFSLYGVGQENARKYEF